MSNCSDINMLLQLQHITLVHPCISLSRYKNNLLMSKKLTVNGHESFLLCHEGNETGDQQMFIPFSCKYGKHTGDW